MLAFVGQLAQHACTRLTGLGLVLVVTKGGYTRLDAMTAEAVLFDQDRTQVLSPQPCALQSLGSSEHGFRFHFQDQQLFRSWTQPLNALAQQV